MRRQAQADFSKIVNTFIDFHDMAAILQIPFWNLFS